MKKVFYIFIFTIILMIPKVTYAACSSSDLMKMKTFASNITYKYDYVEKIDNNSYGSVKFTISFYNLTNDIYIKYVPNYESTGEIVTTGKIDLANTNSTSKIENIEAGKSSRFEVYSKSNSVCPDERLYTFYVATPSYNKYYSSDLCKLASEHKYCKRWSSINISEKDFKNTVEKYLKDKSRVTTIEEDIEPSKTIKDVLIDLVVFLNEYVFIVTIPLISICLILIIILKIRKNKKEKL